MDKVTKSARKPPTKGGSRKGIPNKNTADIKNMVLTALTQAGGVSYLVRCAKDPKTASSFLGLVGKIMPTQVTGADGGPVQMALEVVFKAPNAR